MDNEQQKTEYMNKKGGTQQSDAAKVAEYIRKRKEEESAAKGITANQKATMLFGQGTVGFNRGDQPPIYYNPRNAEPEYVGDVKEGLKDTGQALKERGKQFVDTTKKVGKGEATMGQSLAAFPNLALGSLGDIAGGAVMTAGKAALPKQAEEAIGGAVKTGVSKAMETEVAGAVSEMWNKLPDSAKEDLGSAGNVLSFMMDMLGAKAGTKAVETGINVADKTTDVLGTVGKVTGEALEEGYDVVTGQLVKKGRKAEQALNDQLTNEAYEIVKAPKQKGKKLGERLEGEEVQEGFFQDPTETKVRDKLDMEAAETAKDVVKKNSTLPKNKNRVVRELKKRGEETEKMVKESGATVKADALKEKLQGMRDELSSIYNKDEITKGYYDNVYDDFIEELDKVRKANKTPDGIATADDMYTARKNLDKRYSEMFKGDTKTKELDARRKALLHVRSGVNDTIHDSLPDGSDFKGQLKEMSNLYRADRNMSAKLATKVKLGTRMADWVKRHPYVLFTGSGIGLAATVAPIALPAVLLYGAYKGTKGIVTSKMLKRMIIKAGDKFEDNKELYREILNALDEVPEPKSPLALPWEGGIKNAPDTIDLKKYVPKVDEFPERPDTDYFVRNILGENIEKHKKTLKLPEKAGGADIPRSISSGIDKTPQAGKNPLLVEQPYKAVRDTNIIE